MRRSLVSILLFIGTASVVLPPLSGADDDSALRRWRMFEQEKSDDLASKMAKALNLTDDQKAAVQTAYAERINKLSDLREKFMKDNQAVETAADDKATAALTPEQKAQYADAKEKILAEERQKEMEKRKTENGEGGRGHRGGMGGHGGRGGFGGGFGGF